MLILTRHLGESIVVSDNIVITVVDIARGKIRLGITAPREIEVLREELLERKRPTEDDTPPAE